MTRRNGGLSSANNSRIKKTANGFTIVELLIVIVVIGILAAIVIVAFNGVQNRARNTARATELRSWEKNFMAYSAINGKYPSVPAYGDYCLGTGFPQGADINSQAASIAGAQTVTAPFNSSGYCRDLFSNATRRVPNSSLNAQLATISTPPTSVPKTLSDLPNMRASVGPYVTYQSASVILTGVFAGTSCPDGTTSGYQYPSPPDAIMCTITLPTSTFDLVP